jgi:hypothetical protein
MIARRQFWSRLAALAALWLGQVALVPPAPVAAQLDEDLVLVLSTPAAGARLTDRITISGYAVDRRSNDGPGINDRDVRVYLDSDRDETLLLGFASFGAASPAAAAAEGSRGQRAGFERDWDTCAFAPGPHRLIVWVSSLVAPGGRQRQEREVTLTACPDGAPNSPSVAGAWQSDFGPVELRHRPLAAGVDGATVTGIWLQPPGMGACPAAQTPPGCVGLIDRGVFSAAGRLQFDYYQWWNNVEGSAVLTLSPDGLVLGGSWQQAGASGAWTLTR